MISRLRYFTLLRVWMNPSTSRKQNTGKPQNNEPNAEDYGPESEYCESEADANGAEGYGSEADAYESEADANAADLSDGEENGPVG